jgi:hypothetical protein
LDEDRYDHTRRRIGNPSPNPSVYICSRCNIFDSVRRRNGMRVALRDHGAGVIYDCFARGQGLQPGHERFPYNVCFVQVINDLEARFDTGLLATTELRYQPLVRRFEDALRAAAEKAAGEGRRLVVAFDAVDNAVDQERCAEVDIGPSFLSLLWKITLPANCAVVISFCSENQGLIIPPGAAPNIEVNVQGFTVAEMRQLALARAAAITESDIAFLQQRTQGNARVATMVLKELATGMSGDARTLIDATARSTAFEYYDQERNPGRRLVDEKNLSLLALLSEMRQSPSLATLAGAAKEALADIRERLAELRFGVRVTPGCTVEWLDQDFLDWVKNRLEEQCRTARKQLADFCADEFEQDEYAQWNLSDHFRLAKRYEEILEWWEVPGRLEKQRTAAQPHEERMINDFHALLIASPELGRDEDAVLWLFRAADLLGRRDAFAMILTDRLDVAVAADLVGLIDDEITGGSADPRAGRVSSFRSSRRTWHHDARSDFRLAAALASRRDRREDAKRVYARAF